MSEPRVAIPRRPDAASGLGIISPATEHASSDIVRDGPRQKAGGTAGLPKARPGRG